MKYIQHTILLSFTLLTACDYSPRALLGGTPSSNAQGNKLRAPQLPDTSECIHTQKTLKSKIVQTSPDPKNCQDNGDWLERVELSGQNKNQIFIVLKKSNDVLPSLVRLTYREVAFGAPTEGAIEFTCSARNQDDKSKADLICSTTSLSSVTLSSTYFLSRLEVTAVNPGCNSSNLIYEWKYTITSDCSSNPSASGSMDISSKIGTQEFPYIRSDDLRPYGSQPPIPTPSFNPNL